MLYKKNERRAPQRAIQQQYCQSGAAKAVRSCRCGQDGEARAVWTVRCDHSCPSDSERLGICKKRVYDRKGRSTNLNKEFELELWTRKLRKTCEQKINLPLRSWNNQIALGQIWIHSGRFRVFYHGMEFWFYCINFVHKMPEINTDADWFCFEIRCENWSKIIPGGFPEAPKTTKNRSESRSAAS